MQNWIYVTNKTSNNVAFDLVVSRFSDGEHREEISLAANSTIRLRLSDFDRFGVGPDSYGTVILETDAADKIFGFVTIEHRSLSSNLVDFSFPTIAK